MVSKLKPTFVTDEFIGAVADSLATGNAITLTTAVASATTYTDAQLSGLNYAGSQSATKNLTTNLNSAVVKADTNTIVIDVDLVNQNLNSDFQISTVLINATYKGANILVGVVRFSEPELFPAYDNVSVYELEMKLYISVSRIANATINVNSAGMATAKSVQDLRTYVDGDFNADIARKTKDNIFTGTNTFNKKIIAPAGVQGNADTATKLQTARRINGTTFDGTSDINVNAANDSNLVHRSGNENIAGIKSFSEVLRVGTGSFSGGALEISAVTPYIDFHFNNDMGDYTSRIVEEASGTLNINGVKMKNGVITGSLAGNADTTTKLQTARNIGGVSFDGTRDITLPGVNAKGNQDTSGRAANATNADHANNASSADIANKAVALNTPRKINGTNFDGTADINVPASNDANLVHKDSNETIGGNKNFSDKVTFNKTIAGAIETREAPFKDFNEAATHLRDYQGKWRGGHDTITNTPEAGWFIVDVQTWGDGSDLGHLILRYTDHNAVWVGLVMSGKISWKKLASDDTVMHLTGNENIAGTKNFTGNAIFNNLIDGYTKTIETPTNDINLIKTPGKYRLQSTYLNVPNGMPNSSIMFVEDNIEHTVIYQTILTRDVDIAPNSDVDMFIRLFIDNNWTPWRKLAQDQQVLHLSGDETAAGFKKFSGNIATTSDNSMINGGGNNGDIALVKKNGNSGFLGIGANQQENKFRVKRSSQSSILPTDTFTDMFTVDINGVVKAGTQQDLVPLDKNVAHNSGNETWSGNKTFSDTVTFNKKINGNLQINAFPLTTLQELATKMNTYAGEWVGGSNIITDMPEAGYANISVKPYGNSETAGTIILNYTESNRAFISYAKTPLSWLKISNDATVVHNTGNEDIYGDKTFKNKVIPAAIELFSTTPYIDFHFANDAGDYTSRIIETAKGTLSINGVNISGSTISGTLSGNASSSTKLQTPRNINGVGFDGTSDITVDPVMRGIGSGIDLFKLSNGFYFNAGVASTNKPTAASTYFVVEVIQVNTNGFMRLIDSNGLSFWTTKSSSTWSAWRQDADDATVVHNSGNETIGGSKTFSSTINGSLNGNSTTATKFQTARKIGGVYFDGSTDINLPGVNTTGNQNTTGNAATATKLQFARTINGVAFDGSNNISVNAANDSNLVHKDNNETLTGNKNFSGVATFAKAQTSSTITKTITTSLPTTLQFTETAFGVMVYASGYGQFRTDGQWKTLATLPSGITPPTQTVIMSDVDWAGVGGVTYRLGINLKIAIKPTGEITYKCASLKDNDNNTYDVQTGFDLSTYWSK